MPALSPLLVCGCPCDVCMRRTVVDGLHVSIRCGYDLFGNCVSVLSPAGYFCARAVWCFLKQRLSIEQQRKEVSLQLLVEHTHLLTN